MGSAIHLILNMMFSRIVSLITFRMSQRGEWPTIYSSIPVRQNPVRQRFFCVTSLGISISYLQHQCNTRVHQHLLCRLTILASMSTPTSRWLRVCNRQSLFLRQLWYAVVIDSWLTDCYAARSGREFAGQHCLESLEVKSVSYNRSLLLQLNSCSLHGDKATFLAILLRSLQLKVSERI